MDAGQGDATLLVFPDKSLVLVDCGCLMNRGAVRGEIAAVLDFYLADAPGMELRALVLTHPDSDHYNLIQQLIIDRKVPVGMIFVGGDVDDYADIKRWIKTQRWQPFGRFHVTDTVQKELSFHGGAPASTVTVRVLAANAGATMSKAHANENSIVLLVTYLDVNIFLMGDSTESTEKLILETLDTPAGIAPSRLQMLLDKKRTVLKVGHHGSDTSSSNDWLKRIRPELAFISSDTKSFNGRSLPRKEIIDRLMALGTIHDFGHVYDHTIVQYNGDTDRHESVVTSYGMFTSLHLLVWREDDPNQFDPFGTSWHYDIDNGGGTAITPACEWENINEPYE